MRVFPPVWGFFRLMTTDYQLGDGGPVIPKGHLMGMSPWATHRDGRYWPDPLRFDPERWNKDATRPPDLAYFPFSAGPYQCHGRELAMNEAVLILATLGQALVLPARRPGAQAERDLGDGAEEGRALQARPARGGPRTDTPAGLKGRPSGRPFADGGGKKTAPGGGLLRS